MMFQRLKLIGCRIAVLTSFRSIGDVVMEPFDESAHLERMGPTHISEVICKLDGGACEFLERSSRRTDIG